MKQCRVLNLSKEIILLDNVNIAESFYTRLKGLLGRKKIFEGEGLVIRPCNSIHTMGMNFPIDVAFIDKNNKVIHIIKEIPPGKFSKLVKKSIYVIEAGGNEFNDQRLNIGDELEIKPYKSSNEY